MGRSLRLEYAGALYHVTSRGDRREDIYDDDIDRAEFLALLGIVCIQYNWVCHGYCLMGNHYHLLIETIEGNLSKGMRHLNGVYSQKYNSRHQRVGHVFQGRYHGILVEKENYLLELTRYIVLNPVRAKMVQHVQDWPWSSYHRVIGVKEPEAWMEVDWILSCFNKNKGLAIKSYAQFVAEGVLSRSPMKDIKNQMFLGSDTFVEKGLSLIDQSKDLSEIPQLQRRSRALSLQNYSDNFANRNKAIIKAYASGGYTMKEIGDFFGVGYSMVSRIVKNSKFKT
jgi:putative transposase